METTTIRHEVVIPASPSQVYEGFTDPTVHTAMTGGTATGMAAVGAPFSAWGGYITGTFLELEPNQRIVQSWETSEWPDGAKPSRLELTFEPTDGGTKLTMVHSDVPAEQAPDYDQGWHDNYWDPMKVYFQEQRDEKE